MTVSRLRRRSVGFLDRDDESWACFLVTYRKEQHRWHGYLSFRRSDGIEEDEIRTADIFLESSEAEIDRKARSLGRPLLSGLLASAVDARARRSGGSPELRRRFRRLLADSSRDLGGEWAAQATEEDPSGVPVPVLRSLYASYRMDQVAHLIALLRPADFQAAVDRILEDQSIDFSARDRLQFSMMVVERIEDLLPLPPFEVWVEDFLAHRDEYRLYAHTLHRARRLP